ncbi:MAG TPA: VOC family protein [Sphingobium sp.]|nr:VOC family protein [Sphingobium sp.]
MLTMARFGTRDLDRAKAFYDAVTAPLGATRVAERPDFVSYKGPDGGMFLVGKPFEGEATAGNGTQLGVTAPSRAAVDAAYAKAIELGGQCAGAPGLRGPEEMGFYAAYFRDLDGNKMMVFRTGPA